MTETAAEAWGVLEKFGHDLEGGGGTRRQVRLTLTAVRDALDADCAFWHPGTARDGFALDGALPLTADWADEFVRREGRGGEVLRDFLDPGAKPRAPWPTSAAMARVGGGRWLCALSFHPRRLFGPADLAALTLARGMLLHHRTRRRADAALRRALAGLAVAGDAERDARRAARLGESLGLPPDALGRLCLDVFVATHRAGVH